MPENTLASLLRQDKVSAHQLLTAFCRAKGLHLPTRGPLPKKTVDAFDRYSGYTKLGNIIRLGIPEYRAPRKDNLESLTLKQNACHLALAMLTRLERHLQQTA